MCDSKTERLLAQVFKNDPHGLIDHIHAIGQESWWQAGDRICARVRLERDLGIIREQCKPTPKYKLRVPLNSIEHQAALRAIATMNLLLQGREGLFTERCTAGTAMVAVGARSDFFPSKQVTIYLRNRYAWKMYHKALRDLYSDHRPSVIYNDQVARIKMGECLS